MASRVGTTARRALVSPCTLALVLSLAAAAFAGRASATTSPGFILTVQVNLTDSHIVLVPQANGGRYVNQNGLSAQFPRGIRIHFLFTNKGTKTYVPAIRFTDNSNANPYAGKQTFIAADTLAPGRHTALWGNFYFRGAFVIEKLFHKKPQGRSIPVTIY